MPDVSELLRQALQQVDAKRDLDVPVPDNLVFDDEPIEELLYGGSATPSSANLFESARAYFESMDAYHRARDDKGLLNAARQLVTDGVRVSADGYAKIAPLMQPLIAQSFHGAWRQDLDQKESFLQRLAQLAENHQHQRLSIEVDLWLALLYEFQQRGDEAAAAWRRLQILQNESLARQNLLADLLPIAPFWFWRNLGQQDRTERFALVAALVEALYQPKSETPAQDNSAQLAAPGAAENAISTSLLDGVEPQLLELCRRLHSTTDRKPAHHEICLWCLAIGLLERMAGPRHPASAHCLNMLVRALQRSAEHQTAVELARRAVDIRRAELAFNHPLLATSLNSLGLSLICLNRLDEAEPILQNACDIQPKDPEPKYWFAKLLQKRGRPEDEKLELAAWRAYLAAANADSDYRAARIGRERMIEVQRRCRQLQYH